ncbi:MAG: hypothetical protein A3F72_05000 [Bacteroidetes bacterium RIFCSPLOWO2_12_FULL_35_15]|nr:MAG: hypothetical protein A3F72_05000 [Bacteroidetes bacterium RIFCSPLOWO2_12_FULL_35_15]
MKKHLLFFSAFVLSLFTANAQITITQSDMPSVGKVFVSANDTVLSGISVGASGTNKFWNFAGLLNNKKDTSAFVSPGSLTGSSNFPTANLAISDGDANIFINFNSSSLDLLGVYGDFGPPLGFTALKFTPAQKHITFPSSYLTTFSGTSSYEIKYAAAYPGIDSVKATTSENYTSTMDGWGTITTPAFSNVACLRQYKRTISTNTSYTHMIGGTWVQQGAPTIDTTYDYSWWSNTKKYPLAEIGTNAAGTVTSATYLFIQTATGIEEQAENDNIAIFPNPASAIITIAGLTETSSLNIFDITGKLIESTYLKNSDTPINISGYENGIYFYEVIDKDKNNISKGKFVVAK